jgi:transposase-like protein
MPLPRYCRNPDCIAFSQRHQNWFVSNGTYWTIAHGQVQRFKCKFCGTGMGAQTESIYYYSKRRLNYQRILSRVRGGSSLRDIGRELGCSPTAAANAVLRLGRQSMAAEVNLLCGLPSSGSLCFDGLLSCVTSSDYPSQITTLGDRKTELILSMTHAVTERGGTRTESQEKRIQAKRARWKPGKGALSQSISLLVSELAGYGSGQPLRIDTDEHPLYPPAITCEPRLRWHRENQLVKHRRTPGSAPRTTSNPLFLMNYIDRMIRHRMKEHTRETIAIGRNSTYQMHRMWIFAHDHNLRQPKRVAPVGVETRIEQAGVPPGVIKRVTREFYSRRIAVAKLPVPESMRMVWQGRLETPPVRWRVGQKRFGPEITAFAELDLSRASHQG